MSWSRRMEMLDQDPYSRAQIPQYINETPAKKIRSNYHHSPDPAPFNSQDNSADDLFTDYAETQATNQNYHSAQNLYSIPMNVQPVSFGPNGYMYSNTYGDEYVTQPTQIIHNPAVPHTPETSRVQVPASSPTPAYGQSPGSHNTPSAQTPKDRMGFPTR